MDWATNNKIIKSDHLYIVKLWDQWSLNKFKYAYDVIYQLLNVYGRPSVFRQTVLVIFNGHCAV